MKRPVERVLDDILKGFETEGVLPAVRIRGPFSRHGFFAFDPLVDRRGTTRWWPPELFFFWILFFLIRLVEVITDLVIGATSKLTNLWYRFLFGPLPNS
jgi:hypothetical protein